MKRIICTKAPQRTESQELQLARSILQDIIDYLESRTQWSKTFKIQSLTPGYQHDDTLEYDYTLVDDDGVKLQGEVYLEKDSATGEWYDPRETYDYSDSLLTLWENYIDEAGIAEDFYDDEW